ncbi:hypothetical protein [Roseinatronobacter sp.]
MRKFSLINVSFALVARDIATTLRQFDLGTPQISPAAEDAVSWLTQRGQDDLVGLAIIQASPEEFVKSELYPLLDAAGSKVILLVDTFETAARSSFPSLVLPFFTEDLEALVQKIADD